MAELTIEESIQQTLPTLPLPVQNIFKEGKIGATARLLTERYMLHMDQGAVLEKGLTLALLGILGPEELAAELYDKLPVSRQVILDILTDINKEIFAPLREEEMKSSAGSLRPPVQGATPVGAPRPSAPPAPPGAGQPQTYFHLENKIAPPPRPAQPSAGIPKLAPPPSPLRPAPATPSARPALRDVLSAVMKTPPAGGSKLLEDHEEPHIEFNTTPPVTVPPKAATPPTNPPSVQSRPVPKAAESAPRFTPFGARPKFTPAPNLVPPAVKAPPAPVAPAPPAGPAAPMSAAPLPPKPGTPPAVPATPSAPAKPYAGDPYREPIEP